MLRPATPLALIFLIAFVLLLLSTLSTPIIKAIPLGSFEGSNFGVFGYCNTDDGTCSPIAIGYDLDAKVYRPEADGSFSVPRTTRQSLSAILVVHPIATFLALVCFGLSVAAHFHAPSSSPRFLLGLLILTIPTLLMTLLAFLVDILLFVPHLQWGGWIVLAATILIVFSSVVTCAMRRTLVSRKARQKRIAENADMNGQNFYENQTQTRMMADATRASVLPRADSPPPMTSTTPGSFGMMDKGTSQFATYEMQRPDQVSRDTEPSMTGNDDRTPLNPRSREPSVRSGYSGRRPYNPEDAPPMPRPSMDSQGRPRRPSRDAYGNPIPPGEMGYGMQRRGSQESMGSQYSHGSRGRGGRSRGHGPPRGYYGPPPRGGYGGRGSYRGGPPAPGWNGRGRGGYGPPPPGMRGPPMPQPRPGPPPGYANDNSGFYAGGAAVAMGVGAAGAAMYNQRSPTSPEQSSYVVGSDRGPIGQAIEMDERTGSMPGNVAAQPETSQANYGLRDSDADVNGMVGLQQNRERQMSNDESGGQAVGYPMRRATQDSRDGSSGARSPTSIYSEK